MLKVEVMSEMRIAGHNPELADMDNPNGHIIAAVYFLVVTNERGQRWAGPIVSGPNTRLASALQRAIDRGHNPTQSAAFQPYYPVYGSDEYQAGGWEEEAWRCERQQAGLPC